MEDGFLIKNELSRGIKVDVCDVNCESFYNCKCSFMGF